MFVLPERPSVRPHPPLVQACPDGGHRGRRPPKRRRPRHGVRAGRCLRHASPTPPAGWDTAEVRGAHQPVGVRPRCSPKHRGLPSYGHSTSTDRTSRSVSPVPEERSRAAAANTDDSPSRAGQRQASILVGPASPCSANPHFILGPKGWPRSWSPPGGSRRRDPCGRQPLSRSGATHHAISPPTSAGKRPLPPGGPIPLKRGCRLPGVHISTTQEFCLRTRLENWTKVLRAVGHNSGIPGRDELAVAPKGRNSVNASRAVRSLGCVFPKSPRGRQESPDFGGDVRSFVSDHVRAEVFGAVCRRALWPSRPTAPPPRGGGRTRAVMGRGSAAAPTRERKEGEK